MAITRKLVAQNQDECQVLKMDSIKRYIVNDGHDWQILLGPNSELTVSSQVVKLSAQFNKDDLNSVRIAAYLYNPITGATDNSASCTFSIYKVVNPNWSDIYLTTVSGSQLPNQYWYYNLPLSSIPSVELDGSDSIMIEAVITRLSQTYRDRIYINHLGVYDSIVRLKQDIEYLDITKQDE